jgi:hypothetical protein
MVVDGNDDVLCLSGKCFAKTSPIYFSFTGRSALGPVLLTAMEGTEECFSDSLAPYTLFGIWSSSDVLLSQQIQSYFDTSTT